MDSASTPPINLQERYYIKSIPVVEHLWGHRFRPDQTPMLLLFELFCIIENQLLALNQNKIKKLFDPENDKLYFAHRRCFKLRILLYQNEILESIYQSNDPDELKWQRQIDHLNKIENEKFNFNDDDIAHIRKNYSSFENFYKTLKILSALTYDPHSNKRWSSKFIYPINKEYIWCDINNREGTEDRRFFSRGGELVYLMLCRADQTTKDELEILFTLWLENTNDSYVKLANSLVLPEPRAALESSGRNLGHLPNKELPCFNKLAQDITSTLKLDLERLDKIKILSDMIGFHVGNYIHSVGGMLAENEKNSTDPIYIAEVLTKTSNSIRKASIQSVSTQKNRLKRALTNNFQTWFNHYDKSHESSERKDLLKDSNSDAMDNLNKNIANYANICFRHIGFISRKNTRSFRYVITEDFLHSLVITLLGSEKRLEFNKFTRELRNHYHIYIDQAPEQNPDILQSDLNRNRRDLAALLYQMGMLRHLSDACSYVVNPYSEDAL